MCGKAKYTEQVALKLVKARSYLKGHYKCPLSDTYHVSKSKKFSGQPYGHRRFKFNKNRILRELHTEMTTRKAIRDRIIEYMRSSYERNKTTKFSSQMVTFAVQQELKDVGKQVIAEEISRLKTKTKVIVSLNEKVPDQRGAVYFTLAEILEKETEPSNVAEEVDMKVPTQAPAKPIPVNPFDKVHEKLNSFTANSQAEFLLLGKKLDGIKDTISNSEVTLDDEDFDTLAAKLEERLANKFERLFGILAEIKGFSRGVPETLNEIKTVASSHVTVDGDKLADVINARLGNLKLEDSFLYRVREETDNIVESRLGQYIDMLLDRPDAPSKSDDYRAGIKDGIRMALEMGLKLDE